jgi:signal transduction histidine kinase
MPRSALRVWRWPNSSGFAQAHDGNVAVTDRDGGGAVFAVRLPAA